MTANTEWWIGLLLDVSLKAALLAIVAGIVLALVRIRDSNLEHRVWMSVLVGMLVLPLLVCVTPMVPLPTWLYPEWRTSVEQPLPTTTVMVPPMAFNDSVTASRLPEQPQMESDRLLAGAVQTDELQEATPIVSAAANDVTQLNHAVPILPEASSRRFDWMVTILVAYGLGLALFAGRLLTGLAQVRRLVSGGRPIVLPSHWASPIDATRVLESSAVRVPVTVGWRHPVILLPSDWSSWQESLLTTVLAHERAHVDRRDHWVTLLTEWNRAFYWFHPVAWFLWRRLAVLAEQACDDAVIAALGDRPSYARHLLSVAGRLAGARQRFRSVGVAMARTPKVETRINAILDVSRPLARRLGLAGALAIMAVAVPLVLLAAGLRADNAVENQAEPVAQDMEDNAPTHWKSGPISAEPKTIANAVLSGRIVDETGNPVTDARLELRNRQSNESHEARTDEKGCYHFDAVEQDGEFQLGIKSNGWVGLTNWKKQPRIQLTSRSRIVRDFELQRACQIELQVVDQEGPPIRHATLYRASLAEEYGSSEGVHTDQYGMANIGGIKPLAVDYIVGAYHKDYGYAKLIVPLREAGEVTKGKIALSKGADVVGTAICSDGKPAAGWKVYALPSWWRFGVSHRGAQIGPDGAFTLTHIVPGKYDLNVHIPEGGGSSRTEGASTAMALPPESGRVELRLHTVSPQSMSVIAGKIRYSGVKPIKGFWIHATSVDGEHHGGIYVEADATEFRIASMPPGKYRVTVQEPKIEPVKLSDVTAPTDDLELVIRAVSQPELGGTIVKSDSEEPVTRFRLRINKLRTLRGPNYVQEPRWYDFADSAGRFTVQVPGPGIYRVLVAADGFAWTHSGEVNSDEDASRNICVELGAGATLTGTIVNGKGELIDGAKVIPLSKAGGVVRLPMVRFDTEDGAVETVGGRFTLENLLPGKETLKITHPDYCYAILEDIDVSASGTTLEPITLASGGTLQGHVYDAQGKPEPNVTLYVQEMGLFHGGSDEETGRLAMAVTDINGFYQIQGLPENLCFVRRAQGWNAWGTTSQLILPKNGAVRTLDFGGSTRITGRVLVNGKPLANTRLALGDRPSFGPFMAFAQTSSDGSFVFWGPTLGKWGLYYAIAGRRDKWVRVRDIQISARPLDLGTIDHQSIKLTIRLNGLPDQNGDELWVSLHEYSPYWMYALKPPQRVANSMVFNHVVPARYELIFNRPGGYHVRLPVEVGATELDQHQTIEWPRGTASISGRMGPAAQKVSPWLKSTDGTIWGALPGDSGTYQVEDLPAGDYFITDQFVRDPRPVVEFSLKEGEQKKLDLTADLYSPSPTSRGILALRVFTPEGVPLTGFDATVAGAGGELRPGPKPPNGEVHFIGPAGRYRLAASYPGFETVEREVELKLVIPGAMSYDRVAVEVYLRPTDSGSATE